MPGVATAPSIEIAISICDGTSSITIGGAVSRSRRMKNRETHAIARPAATTEMMMLLFGMRRDPDPSLDGRSELQWRHSRRRNFTLQWRAMLSRQILVSNVLDSLDAHRLARASRC